MLELAGCSVVPAIVDCCTVPGVAVWWETFGAVDCCVLIDDSGVVVDIGCCATLGAEAVDSGLFEIKVSRLETADAIDGAAPPEQSTLKD